MSIEISRPKTVPINSSLIKVTKNELWARVSLKSGRAIISIERKIKREGQMVQKYYDVYIYGSIDGKPIEESYTTVEECSGDSEIDRIVCYYINNWDYLRKKRNAEILFNSDFNVVPNHISERETLAYELAQRVLEEYEIRAFFQGKSFIGYFCFNKTKGVFEECEERLKARMMQYVAPFPELSQKTTRWVIAEALNKVRELRKEVWKPNLRKLAFKGAVLDWERFIETGVLEASVSEPSPDDLVFHYIPHRLALERLKGIRRGLEAHLPPSTAEDVIALFKKLAPKSYEAFKAWVGEENVILLLELIGYALYPGDYPLQYAFMLVGEGSNGKTTFLTLLRDILGDHNVSSVDLKELNENRFAIAELFLKLANISAEPVTGVLKSVEVFKKLTGGDLVKAERKFKDPFMFMNYAKLVFSANDLPEVKEDTYAFWRRWIMIRFPHKFPRDPTFYRRTFTEDEIEGIILAALHAFRLAYLRKGFSVPEGHNPAEEWRRRSNPVYRVMKELEEEGYIEFDPKGQVLKDELYLLYSKYVERLKEEDERVRTVSKGEFTKKLEQHFGIYVARPRIAGKRTRVYVGVRIKDPEKFLELVGKYPTVFKSLEEVEGV